MAGGGQAASGAPGQGAPVGLSHVHIPSSTYGAYDGITSGKYRDTSEGRYCHGQADAVFSHPTGEGLVSDGDYWISARRWRDGLSVGCGRMVDPECRPDTRGEVREFTEASRGRMVRYLREAEADYRYFGTLTVGDQYSRDPEDFRRAVDRWLVQAMRALKAAHRKKGESESEASIFWFVEFQSRGAPHLHIFYTRWVHWKPLAEMWARLCLRFNLCGEHEVDYFWRTSTKFEKFKYGFRGMVSYARKYASKSEQKQEVEGTFDGGWRGRFWGVRGNRRRGSCHLICHARSTAAGGLRGLRKWLDSLSAEGKLKRIPWIEGDGAIYLTPDGRQLRETGFHVELELRLARIALAIGEANADSLHQSTEQNAPPYLDAA